jgi:hypothetical protein
MGFNCGIVGLPNVGKSTLFNALTKTASAQAANYPFCTIEPNVGRVAVPDPRLYQLASIAGSQKIVPTFLEIVDIAGLVRGASKGEGLGNQFLGHIRQVDALLHVLRCFEDADITHVEGSVDPIRDIETIEAELLLADYEFLERRQVGLEKKVRAGDKEAKAMVDLIHKILAFFAKDCPARKISLPEDEKKLLKPLQLLTSKPVLYVCNVAENEAATGNGWTEKVKSFAAQEGNNAVVISAAIEAEIAALDSEEDKKAFLQSLGLAETGLDQIVREGYHLLDLLTFFTVGPKEARAWTVHQQALAPEAAGVIHTDFERGFICAETISFEDYIAYNGEQGAKAAGKMRLEGREYAVKDGDVFYFRFNV